MAFFRSNAFFWCKISLIIFYMLLYMLTNIMIIILVKSQQMGLSNSFYALLQSERHKMLLKINCNFSKKVKRCEFNLNSIN